MTCSPKTQKTNTWKAFSRYIRVRDSIRTTGTISEVVCFTCGERLDTMASQAGHIVSRAYSGALYNERVVYAQCVNCNAFKEGNHILGFLHLEEMVGYDKAREIVLDSMKPKKHTKFDLEDLEEGCLAATEIMEEHYAKYAN
jgi:hypothetical protein